MLREIKFQGRKIKFNEQDEADRSVAAEIFKFREYRAAEPVINQAKIIVDVGAHIGLFVLYCHALNTSAKIFALEPELKNFNRLNGNIALNSITNAKTLPVALAGKTGKGQLMLAEDSHNHYLGLQDAPGEAIEVALIDWPTLKKREKIKHIDVLKMDIEGGEYEVIESFADADWESVKTIILEYHEDKTRKKDELEDVLRENRFGVQVFPSKFDKRMGFIFAINKR